MRTKKPHIQHLISSSSHSVLFSFSKFYSSAPLPLTCVTVLTKCSADEKLLKVFHSILKKKHKLRRLRTKQERIHSPNNICDEVCRRNVCRRNKKQNTYSIIQNIKIRKNRTLSVPTWKLSIDRNSALYRQEFTTESSY